MKTIFTRGLQRFANREIDLSKVCCLLVRDTSTYVPNVDHDYVSDFTGNGGVELTAAGYSRQVVGSVAGAVDDANDRAELSGGDLNFGDCSPGETIAGLLYYERVGADDSTPGDDPMLLWIDGKIKVTLAANAAQNATTIWIDPLDEDLPSGAALDFGGGATCTLSAGASAGTRSLSVSALAAAATAGASSSATTAMNLPVATGGGAVQFTQNAEGILHFRQAGGI